ncbi:MAG: hypothetical protein HY319_08485 [Armatimonadetes bacterium]|nr:hypothetical protein [Armatimonadota bacterium]
MTTPDIIGTWIAAFLTLCIFSFLYGDNPFYKFAEHVFVGVSAGYWMVLGYWQNIYADMIGPLQTGDLKSLFPALLGLLMLGRLFPKIEWISRWPVGVLVGVFAGLNIVNTMQAQVLDQMAATIVPLWGNETVSETVVNWILVLGVFTGLIYFYFSVEHKGWFFGGASRVGIWVLMIAFGAAFGYTVMSRISLLIGRVFFFKDDWWPAAEATWRAAATAIGGGG